MNTKIIDIKNAILKENIYYLISDYKSRNNKRKNHNGIDLLGYDKSSDYVIAIDDGVVIASKYSLIKGYYVEIKHHNNYISKYLHLKKDSIKVKKGDYIKKGDILGYMGESGNTNGIHLHFAIYNDKKIVQDPLPYLLNTLNFEPNYFHEFIINIQHSLGTKVDGIKGPNTFNKTITISSTTNNRHKVVKHIQNYLYKLGYKEIGKADGIAGIKFTNAIKKYQKDHGLVEDGIITRKNNTWRKLLRLI